MYENAEQHYAGMPTKGMTPLDQAQQECNQEASALGEMIGELAIRLMPIMRQEEEPSPMTAVDGMLRASGESPAVSFVRDQQQRCLDMRRKVEGLLRRIDV